MDGKLFHSFRELLIKKFYLCANVVVAVVVVFVVVVAVVVVVVVVVFVVQLSRAHRQLVIV